MSARENSPLQCLSPLTSEMEHETSIQAEFKSFSNPTLGLSVSCSLAQLADLKQMLTPALADQAQQAPFFTPFSNKTYDSVQVSDSVAFYTAMETGLRSSQTVRTDVHGSVQSRKLLGKALLFGDGIPTGCAKANGSRPSSHGSGVAALEPSKPVNISALDKPAAPAVKIMDDEAPEIANQAVAAVSNSVAVTDVSQIPAREPDEESDCLDRAEADADTLDLASTDNGVQPECSERTPADSTSLCRPLSLAGDSSCSTELDDAAQSPANLDDLTMEALLPANFLLDNLLEGSGETSGNPNLVCPRTTRKPSPGPAESTHAQGQPPIIPKREKVYGSCTPRLAHAGVAPGGASTARKVHGSGTALHRQRSDVRDTPASSAKLVTSGKQSQARTGKANTTATNTPGRQSSQKPRRPSSVGADAAREAAPKMAGHTTPPHSAGKTGTAMLPAAGDAKAVPVALAPAENQTAAAVGTGTPFFVKRVRPALGSSPPVTPFSAMKCPPAVRGQAGGTGATATASPAAVIPTAAAPTGAGPPPEQRAKRSVRAKAQATVPAAAKAADPDAKTGQETKAAPGPGRGGETRRNSSANAAAKTASGTKPAAPGAAKSGSVPGGTRAAVAHAAKLSAPAGPAAVHGKQAGSKHTGDVVTKAQAEEAELDEPIEAHPVILGRVSPVGGLGASSAAACRYGKAEAAVSDLSTEPTNGRAACHSPDKLPPSKRQAIPITSPSKRPRQERNPSVTAQVLVTARPASVGCRGGAVRAASRPASSPAARGALAGKSNRSQSASVRRPRPSLPSATAEVAPSQISLQAAPGDAGKDAPAQPLLPVSSPTVAKPLTLVKAQHVPKLNLDSLVPCKSPIGTPHMRNNAAAVAADMVPLRQQPVSTRSPVLPGSAAVSSRRPSAMSLSGVLAAADVAQVVLPPAVAAAEVQGINAVVKQGPIMPVPHKQLESQENAREPPADPPRRDGRPTLDPSHGGAGKAKASNERAAAAAPAAAGDGIRPLTARYVTRVPATAVAHGPAAPRSLSARPSGVHKPVSAMGSAACYGSAVPKATAGAAGALKTAAAPLQAITGAGKLAKSAAFAATTAPAPKARPTVPHGNRQGDAAPQRNRVAEPQVPGAAVEDNKSVQRQVPRGGTVTAVQPTRQEVPSRSARLDAEQERAQRRRQYEALLGRSGPVSHVSQELGVSAVDATAILAPPANGASAPAPAVKPAVKPPGVRMSIQASVPQQEKVLVRKAPVPQANPARASTRQPAGSGDGCPAPQPQRGKVASPAFKQTASGTATGNGSRTARGRPDGSAAAADARTPRVRTPLIATEHGSGRKEGQLGMAAATSTAASEEPFDTQHPGSFLAIDEGPKQADAGKDAKESSTPTRPNDLSWLVDTSPQTSLAATPGALNAVHHVFADASSFGFGPAQEDGTEPDASSPNFHVFGASPGEPQLQLVASPSALCEGGEPTGPFGGCQGDATAVVRKQPAFAAAHPVGLPPTGLAPGGLGANAVPSSVFSVRSVQQLTPGPGLYKFTAANRAKAAMGGANNCDDAPAMLPQAKLRFSWDPAATGAIPGQPGVYTCPSPGMADSFLGFGTAAVQEATPVSIPDAAGFCVVTDIGGRLVSVGALGDAENTLDQDLGVEVPIPMQCTSPNTPPSDAYGALGGGAGAVDQGVVMFGGGGGGGMGRAGRVVQDSFDALRISSMSSWPMLRDREPADVPRSITIRELEYLQEVGLFVPD